MALVTTIPQDLHSLLGHRLALLRRCDIMTSRFCRMSFVPATRSLMRPSYTVPGTAVRIGMHVANCFHMLCSLGKGIVLS